MSGPPVDITTEVGPFMASLNPGDLLLFDTISPISELIKFAENRPINHCAIFLGDDEIAQARAHVPAPDPHAPPLVGSAQKADLRELLNSRPGIHYRTVTALRHVGAPTDPRGAQAVVKRAKQYIDSGRTKYNYLSLILLMVPSLYRTYKSYFKSPKTTQRVAELMETIGQALLDAYEKDLYKPSKYPGMKTLTCSEFVYRCFTEALPEYALKLTDPLGDWEVDESELDEAYKAAVVARSSGLRMAAPSDGAASGHVAVSGYGLVKFNACLRTGLASSSGTGTVMTRGVKLDLAKIAGEAVLDVLLQNIGLKKYHKKPGVKKGEVIPEYVTPRDLWSSPSVNAVSVFHRPPRHERGLDNVIEHH
jgi:hypothetical protein